MDTTVNSFLEKFLRPSGGNSAGAVADRIRFWIGMANRPEDFVKGDPSPYAISAKRRTARQNLRRLLKKHPQVAAQIMRESEVEK